MWTMMMMMMMMHTHVCGFDRLLIHVHSQTLVMREARARHASSEGRLCTAVGRG